VSVGGTDDGFDVSVIVRELLQDLRFDGEGIAEMPNGDLKVSNGGVWVIVDDIIDAMPVMTIRAMRALGMQLRIERMIHLSNALLADTDGNVRSYTPAGMGAGVKCGV